MIVLASWTAERCVTHERLTCVGPAVRMSVPGIVVLQKALQTALKVLGAARLFAKFEVRVRVRYKGLRAGY